MSLVISDPRQREIKPVTDSLRGPTIAGVAAMGFFFIGLGGWAAMFEVASAVQSSGVIKVESNRQAVQHLEGGIVRELLVKEGQHVEQGQVLVRLDDTNPRANLDLLAGQYHAYKAIQARLVAERDRLTAIEFPKELMDKADDPDVAGLMKGQVNEFTSRARSLAGQVSVLRERIAQSEKQIEAYQAEVQSSDRQLHLINDELTGTLELYNKGYAPKTRVLALQRSAAQLAGQKGDYLGNMARARQQIAESELQIAQLQKERDTEIAQQLRDMETKLIDLAPRFRTVRDVLKHIEVKAPRTGRVVQLTAFTVGGVVQPREHILDIVPDDSPLVLEGQIRPEDIDDVRVGMAADVHLTAFKQRITPVVHGTVKEVSADRWQDPRTMISYYVIRVELDKSDLERLPHVKLSNGMPAEITIPTESRTVLDYLITPLYQSFNHALREK